MGCTYLLVGISDLSVYKMTCLCSNYEWGTLENKHIYCVYNFRNMKIYFVLFIMCK